VRFLRRSCDLMLIILVFNKLFACLGNLVLFYSFLEALHTEKGVSLNWWLIELLNLGRIRILLFIFSFLVLLSLKFKSLQFLNSFLFPLFRFF
jgi:hypothetical protein